MSQKGAESLRLIESQIREQHWKRWGPYLSARQWGTVREDYSPDGSCWSYFPFEHADKRAYRWGEDGIFGFTDRKCRICLSIALWNKRDPILKERLFGLTGPQGNHGEDVKELYFHLKALPTYSYCSALYKYPQEAFPYERLRSENAHRSLAEGEFEILDSGVFDSGRYFDVRCEFAKGSPNDILVRYSITNYSSERAELVVLPTVWFRNTWSWGREGEAYTRKPLLKGNSVENQLEIDHPTMGNFRFSCRTPQSFQGILFTENETNFETLFQQKSASPYVKDGIQRYLISGESVAINPAREGTKASFHFDDSFAPGETKNFEVRLTPESDYQETLLEENFEEVFEKRLQEAAEFYDEVLDPQLSPEERNISEQAYAGLLWNKQFYYYSIQEWEEGDPTQPTPAPERKGRRNGDWGHLYNMNIISMPDKWEYPWYAAWDLAFHAVAFARVDPEFAKQQLILLLREWYMHPNGQIPAYEFAFSDVNPPVHAWACWRVYKMTAPKERRDRDFLARAFHKLLINFTWWVNRKDVTGNNLFTGG
ncbi:MAG: hypothetical protein KDD64_15840, partial [Bdellovibrionales bacterium]|nr:hypothetical protein [Bdellovibrionales bacterium]